MNKQKEILINAEYSGAPGASWSSRTEVLPSGDVTVIKVSDQWTGEVYYERTYPSANTSFRTLINACASEPGNYSLPITVFHDFDFSCDGLDDWEETLLPIFCGDQEDEALDIKDVHYFDPKQLGTLDDEHLEAFAHTLGTMDIHEESEKFDDFLEKSGLEDADLMELIDRFELRGSIDFWQGLMERLEVISREHEEETRQERAQIKAFTEQHQSFFDVSDWDKSTCGRHPMSSAAQGAKNSAVYRFVWEYHKKHGKYPGGKQTIKYPSPFSSDRIEAVIVVFPCKNNQGE